MSELILSFRSSSPSPSVILPFRSRIVTLSTTRSSICIAAPPARPRSGAPAPPPSRRPNKACVRSTGLQESMKKDRPAYYAGSNTVKKMGLFRTVRFEPTGGLRSLHQQLDTSRRLMFPDEHYRGHSNAQLGSSRSADTGTKLLM